ncbi:MAG TPA: hypothetical protein VM870_08765 [Pyrinomonadaceae bacterium]|nr:hypothetical protein [Pyrinomonadaceae bacterium]
MGYELRKPLTILALMAAFEFGIEAPMTKAQNTNTTGVTSAIDTTSAANISDALARLPASEAVMYFDVRRVLSEGLPRAFGNSDARLAAVNRDIEAFKTRTGLDAREFDTAAVSLKFTPRLTSLFPPRGTLQVNPVVIARGRFDANRIFAAGRDVAQNTEAVSRRIAREKETSYKDIPIYTLKVGETVKVFGLIDLGESEIAIAALDANTLAIGKPQTVRAAIDANRGGKRVETELVQLAARTPTALMGFAGRVPGVVSSRIDLGDEELSRRFRSVRLVYGSVALAADSFEMLSVLRATDAGAAQELSGTITALQSFIPGLISQLPAAVGTFAAANARNIRIAAEGNEVIVRVQLLPPTSVAAGKFSNKVARKEANRC